jgi:hypothetical protein
MLGSAWKFLALSALGVALAAPACSGEVIEQSSSTGATGTSGATSGTSGASGSGGAGAGVPDGGGGTGGSPAVCGGKGGSPCGADEFCAFEPAALCGYADGTGLCQPRPQVCTDDCPGVCGCDGAFYCNTCSAQAAGVDVIDSKDCMASGSGGSMSAAALATNAPRFIIFKADPVRDVCFRMMVEGLSNPFIGITTPPGWSVGLLEVTDHASDCSLVNGYPAPPAGSAAKAVKASGSITFDNTVFPCKVTIHTLIGFDAQAPWVPPVEALDADMLAVVGGCG